MMIRPPILSEHDPSEEAEGSIDPLGLQAAYERLADRFLPAVTVRMGRPRFLTAMAIGARVCESWDSEAVATDDVTQPWLVFEWFVVEAFVRARDVLQQPGGFPGVQKVERALRNQRPISASAYLKTPTVFGFSGVFRRLARHLGVLTDDGRLDDAGYELVNAWAKDQGLAGFLDATEGSGAVFREKLRRAVAQGMEKGYTTHQASEFWREVALRLDPGRPGKIERGVLLRHIEKSSGPAEMVSVLIRALVSRGTVVNVDAESGFLRKITTEAPAEMRELLLAIDVYEAFSRAVTDAFDWLRHLSYAAQGAFIGAVEFAACKASTDVLKALRQSLKGVQGHNRLLEWEKGLEFALAHFEAVRREPELYEAILAYHERIQREKPPEGKRAWFEHGRQRKVLVRPGFALAEVPVDRRDYVHEYRIPTFSGFLADLGAIA